MLNSCIRFVLSTGVLLLLTACGGGGGSDLPQEAVYSGITTQATVNIGNAGDISLASFAATKHAVSKDDPNNLFVQFSVGITPREMVVKITQDALKKKPPIISALSVIENGECGGTLTKNETLSSENGSSGTAKYNNYCVSLGGYGDVVLDGDVSYAETFDPASFTLTYHNVVVTYLGHSYTLDLVFSCDVNYCGYSSDFAAVSGRVYRASSMEVTGDNASGYTIYLRVYDSRYGYVDVWAENITICDNGNIGAGTITIRGSSYSEAITATPTSCSQMVVVYQSVGAIYEQ